MVEGAGLGKGVREKIYKDMAEVTGVDVENWSFKERGFRFRFDV